MKKIEILLSIVVLSGFTASCLKKSNSQSDVMTAGGFFDSTPPQVSFDLAKWVQKNDDLAALQQYVGSGGNYLELGQQSRFLLRTNMTVTVNGNDDAFTMEETSAKYWADGWVFTKRINSNVDQGGLLDIQLTAVGSQTTAQAYIRFLGQEKYRGAVTKKYKQKFTRDLSFGSTVYPLPLLGVGVSGNIGGELGITLGAGINDRKSVELDFMPSSGLNAGLTGKVELLKFARAEAIGTVALFNVTMPSKTIVSYIAPMDMLMETIAVDGTKISALNGTVQVGASVGLDTKPILPLGVDATLWKVVTEVLPFPTSFIWQWKHTIWHPQPIMATFPAFADGELQMIQKPLSNADCMTKSQLLKSDLDTRRQTIANLDNQTSGQDDDTAVSAAQIQKELNSFSAEEQVYEKYLNICNTI